MLDLLAAELALEDYRNTKADELTLMKGPEHKREALQVTLLSSIKLNSLVTESRVTVGKCHLWFHDQC